jgi:putative restriction endonuclease
LEAAHIKPFSESGPSHLANGLLLRADLHKLFDAGYITVTGRYQVEVSKKIKEEFENGKEYYKSNGENLLILPNRLMDRPHPSFLDYHNNKIYNG